MVDHELLLKKLEAYGILNTELKWCWSYLTGRKQVIHLDGKESSEELMEHGVPQGSILGPLFFILFINDLLLHVSSQVDLYADDTTLTASAHFNDLPGLTLSLNISANEVRQWAASNKLPINESKSKVLTINGKHLASKINDELLVTVEDNRLVNVKSATLLGLTIDSSFSFDCHVENLCKKLASHIGVLSKIRALLSLKQRLLFYNVITRPVMSYADVIWSSCDKNLLNRVLKLQKRAARIILYADRLAPSVTLFNTLDGYLFTNRVK